MASSEETSVPPMEMGGNLNLQQLTSLKNNLDQELSLLQDSLQSLKMAQQKFQESGECLSMISPDYKGKSVLVPLTGSMYVPGRVSNPDKVVINIGTGYYAEKDIETGRDYFKRKVAFVTEQMEKVQAIGLEKSKIRDALMEMIEKIVQGQMAKQALAAGQPSTS